MKITNKVKFYRELKRLTQKELAEKSNLSERNIQSIETFAQEPKISTAWRIANALEKELKDVFPLQLALAAENKPFKK